MQGLNQALMACPGTNTLVYLASMSVTMKKKVLLHWHLVGAGKGSTDVGHRHRQLRRCRTNWEKVRKEIWRGKNISVFVSPKHGSSNSACNYTVKALNLGKREKLQKNMFGLAKAELISLFWIHKTILFSINTIGTFGYLTMDFFSSRRWCVITGLLWNR